MTEKSIYLTKKEASSYLTGTLGLPVAVQSLSKYITHGGGPAYQKFGGRVVYTKDALLAWANARLSPVYHSSAEEVAYA